MLSNTRSPTMPKCATCLFWHELDPTGEGVEADGNYEIGEAGAGRCRRYPPRGPRRDAPEGNIAFDVALWAEWPLTTEEDWCGEHHAVDAVKAEGR